MINCDFCDEIYDIKNVNEIPMLDKRKSTIAFLVHDKTSGDYSIFCQEHSDFYYYCHTRVMDINFCPVCGKQLNMNYKRMRGTYE